MGTLFDQSPRRGHEVSASGVREFLDEVKVIAEDYKMSMPDVIEAYRVLENKRRNLLYINNGDAFDEQIAGIGKIFKEFVKHIVVISHSLESLERIK